jgi:hypothetical protein
MGEQEGRDSVPPAFIKKVAKVAARGGLEIAAEQRLKRKYFRFPL